MCVSTGRHPPATKAFTSSMNGADGTSSSSLAPLVDSSLVEGSPILLWSVLGQPGRALGGEGTDRSSVGRPKIEWLARWQTAIPGLQVPLMPSALGPAVQEKRREKVFGTWLPPSGSQKPSSRENFAYSAASAGSQAAVHEQDDGDAGLVGAMHYGSFGALRRPPRHRPGRCAAPDGIQALAGSACRLPEVRGAGAWRAPTPCHTGGLTCVLPCGASCCVGDC